MVPSDSKYGSLQAVSECLAVEELASFVAGRGGESAHIDEHLARCRACRRAVVLLASAVPSSSSAPHVDASQEGAATIRPAVEFGRYTVLEAVGAGSTGVVYAAYDPSLDRKIALKVLRQGIGGAEGRLLFREARALARVSDEHVVHVFDVGVHDGREFVAMEFVEGETLGAWIAREKPPASAIVDVMLQAARGLAAAHGAGLVHRDFKPENVLLSARDDGLRAKVADFGLAHGVRVALLEMASPGETAPAMKRQQRLALSSIGAEGAFIGTPAYMAPEQAVGEPIDARSDQFSFCVVLYEALSGSRPFPSGDLAELLTALRNPNLSVSAAKLPLSPEGRRAIERGLLPKAVDRFPNMEALAAALRPRPRRLASWWARGAAALLLLGAGLFAWASVPRVDPCTALGARGKERFTTERRQAIREAFLATGLPYAESSWQRVDARLDAELDGWAERRAAVCTEVASSGATSLLDLRNSCLQSTLLYTSAFIDSLEHTNAEGVKNAVAAAYALPSATACDDFEALLNRGVPPPSADNRARYDELEALLAQASAALHAGQYADAAGRVAPILGAAEALGDKPLLAKVLLFAGSTAERLGKFDDARASYERSALVALAGKDDVGALAAGARLVPVLAYRFSETPEAQQWIAQTSALAERLGERAHPHDAILLEGRGIAAYEKGDYAQAKQHYSDALARLERRDASEVPEVAAILLRLAHAQRYLGEYEAARATLAKALELRVRLFGDAHPLVADVQTELGALYAFNGRISEAHQTLEQALALQLRALGPNHIDVAYTINRIGNLELAWGQLDAALARFERVLALGEAALGAHNTEVGMAHHNLAECLWRMGKLEQAELEESSAERIVVTNVGSAHPYVAMIKNGTATIRRLQGKPEEAARLHGEALAIVERAVGPGHSDCADLKIELGRDALAMGDFVTALARFSEAARTRDVARMHPLDAVTLDLDWSEAARGTGDIDLAQAKLGAARTKLAALTAAHVFPRSKALLARLAAAETSIARH